MHLRSLHPFAAILLLCALISAQAAPAGDKTLTGFDREGAERQRALEARYDALLKKENLREWMKRLSARPHHVGSAYDKENTEFMLALFRSWGYDAEIEQFDVLFPTPKTRLLELTAPEKYTARLGEPQLKEDATSGQTAEQLPIYNAYSADGDVTGQLVYVNYGVPRDYEELERRGIDVKGKIVIARYGGSWRGIKPKVAAEHGAIGCIIYSDPRDDGYAQGDV
ncbi:MAG: folate hydrolase, partial [Rubrivivax sp.]|nr:folate hydrolase [Pyrinomonadaceae bacterium]